MNENLKISERKITHFEYAVKDRYSYYKNSIYEERKVLGWISKMEDLDIFLYYIPIGKNGIFNVEDAISLSKNLYNQVKYILSKLSLDNAKNITINVRLSDLSTRLQHLLEYLKEYKKYDIEVKSFYKNINKDDIRKLKDIEKRYK